jgi:hypothetical protein
MIMQETEMAKKATTSSLLATTMLLLLYAVSFLASFVFDKVQRCIQHALVTILKARLIRNQQEEEDRRRRRRRRR